ncbi:MAG TPA: hypothetical protein VLG45_10565, partial [Thermodesulfobacteriota bacterium]|nr:hypothetical protein [Thermodesulfobacteriota bacterium]
CGPDDLPATNIGAEKVAVWLLGESDRFLTRSESFVNVGKYSPTLHVIQENFSHELFNIYYFEQREKSNF